MLLAEAGRQMGGQQQAQIQKHLSEALSCSEASATTAVKGKCKPHATHVVTPDFLADLPCESASHPTAGLWDSYNLYYICLG